MKKIYKIFFLVLYGVWGFYGNVCAETQVEKLIREKRHKVKVLEECSSKVKGFRIAGISTLGLTAAGITGNVLLAEKQKKLDKELDAARMEVRQAEKDLIKIKRKIKKGIMEKSAETPEKQKVTETQTTEEDVEVAKESRVCPGDAYLHFVDVCPECASEYNKDILCREELDDRWFSSGFELAEDGNGVWVYHLVPGYEFAAALIDNCKCKWVKEAEEKRKAEGRPFYTEK